MPKRIFEAQPRGRSACVADSQLYAILLDLRRDMAENLIFLHTWYSSILRSRRWLPHIR